MSLKITPTVAMAAVTAVVDAVDIGTEDDAQTIVFSGPVPASIGAIDAEQNGIIATFDMQNPAFGPAAMIGNSAEALAFELPTVSAASAGEATFFRVYDRNGDPVFQGTVGEGDDVAELILNQKTVTLGADVTVTRLVVGMNVA